MSMTYFPLGRIHVFSKQPLSKWRLKLASNKLLVVPLALFALSRLGSKRSTDQSVLQNRI